MYDNHYDFYELSKVPEEPEKKKGTPKRTIIKRAGLLVLAGLLVGGSAGLAFQGVNYVWDSRKGDTVSQDTPDTSTPSIQTASISSDGNTTGQSLDVSDIANGAMPSIVSITNKSVQEVQNYYDMFGMGGRMLTQEVESAGSGIIIGQNEEELLIATNNHVAEDASTLSVGFIDGTAYEANVKGTDTDRDLAVIAVPLSDITEDTMSQIKVIQMGDSDSLQVGEQVVAIGNALGYGQSVTTGIVSALNRTLDSDGENDDDSPVFIQTDAAINPGNSGGALLNMKGELVGINSAKLASTEIEGMGYAIPLSEVEPILEDLMNRTTREKVGDDERSSLGISCQNVNSQASEMYGIPEGVYVSEVAEGSAAEKAGIKKGYIITKFDGTSVSTTAELKSLLEYYAKGETVEVTVELSNNGEYVEQTLSVTLDQAGQ